MDFEVAAKISGARFVVLQGQLARLEPLAILCLIHIQKSLLCQVVPALVRDDGIWDGQLPKFKEDLFRTEEGFWLIPTAEVPEQSRAGTDFGC